MLLVGLFQFLFITSQIRDAAGFPFLENKWKASKLSTASTDNSTIEKRGAGYRRIDVSGIHAFQPPRSTDRRGPCPALNALANHNYFPRDGIVSLIDGATVPSDIYGIGIELSTVLSVVAVLISGNWLSLSWSIGGAMPGVSGGLIGSLLPNLFGTGQGLSRSHNKYETDASVSHGGNRSKIADRAQAGIIFANSSLSDFSIFNGDVDSVQIPKFKHLLDLQAGKPQPDYDFAVFSEHRKFTLQDSISRNPYFFYGPISGLLVSNAGHCFVPEMMANFTADYPDGLLSRETLMTFFAVFEDPVTKVLTHKRGWERIPDNWYRRPTSKPDYGTVTFLLDLLRMAKAEPRLLKVGGNTNGVNTFTGIDVSNIFGAAYSSTNLLNIDRLVCFFYRILLAVLPDMLQGGIIGSLLSTGLALINGYIFPLVDPVCPGIPYANMYLIDRYPGASVGP